MTESLSELAERLSKIAHPGWNTIHEMWTDENKPHMGTIEWEYLMELSKERARIEGRDFCPYPGHPFEWEDIWNALGGSTVVLSDTDHQRSKADVDSKRKQLMKYKGNRR